MEDDDDNDARVPQGATEMLLRIIPGFSAKATPLVNRITASLFSHAVRGQNEGDCNYVNGDDLARLCRLEGTGTCVVIEGKIAF